MEKYRPVTLSRKWEHSNRWWALVPVVQLLLKIQWVLQVTLVVDLVAEDKKNQKTLNRCTLYALEYLRLQQSLTQLICSESLLTPRSYFSIFETLKNMLTGILKSPSISQRQTSLVTAPFQSFTDSRMHRTSLSYAIWMMRDKALNKLPYSPRKATKTHSCSVEALSNFWRKVLTVSRAETSQSHAA